MSPLKRYKGTTGKCWDSDYNFNAVFVYKSFSHSEILVSCPFNKLSMKESIGSPNFVAENISKSFVLFLNDVLYFGSAFAQGGSLRI